MATAMRSAIEHELQLHATALRGLARDLVGERDADDLVQETALQALRAPPRRPGPLGGWLAGVVRHLAFRLRRGERRRTRREQLVARAEAQPPDAAVEDHDTLRRLTEAVLALPEPYRGAVFLRYLRDLTPSEVAARSGEPVATIKSRLQRGLALLRERLDREGRGEWRGALATTFGLEPLAAATGVLLMGTGTKLVFGGAAALLAVALWWGLASAEPPAPLRSDEVPRAGGAPAVADARAAGGAEERREGVPVAGDREAAAAPDTTVSGCCVDERGQPLAGCTVTLHGKARSSRSRDFPPGLRAWLASHPGFRWQDAEVVTAADGRFTFPVAWSPHHFEVVLRRDQDALPLTARVGALQAGQARDLGDLVVPVTCTLRGTVVDDAGARVPQPWLNVLADESKGTPPALTAPYCTPVVGADGTFTGKIVAGSYDVSVPGRTILSGERVLVAAGTASLEATVVVRALAAADTITGTVVDEREVPLAGIKLYSLGNGFGYGRSDERGNFVVYRPAGDRLPRAELLVWHEGFAPYAAPGPVDWGSTGHHVVLRPALALEVHVTADGRPVEDFGLHCRAAPGNPVRYVGDDVAEDTGDHHDGGVVRLSGLAPGDHVLTVVPVRGDLGPSPPVPVTMPQKGSLRVDVALEAAGSRMLRVLSAEGVPAPGTTIELIDARGGEVTEQTSALAFADRRPGGREALRLVRGTSDARGELLLHGPRHQRLVLRLTGKGQAPLVLTDVALEVAEPLLVVLPRGARLQGTLGPAELVRSLRAARNTAEGARPEPRNLPGFRLRRGDGAERVSFPAENDPAVQVGEDGTFLFDHVPAGTFHLALEGWSFDRPGRRGLAEPVATVELREGQTSAVAVDLPAWLPATVEGQLLRNGVPWAEQTARLIVRHEDVLGRQQQRWEEIRTDRDGRFVVRTRQGHANLAVTQRQQAAWHTLRAAQEVFVASGQVTGAVFAIDSGTLRLRLVGADGKPVAGVPVVLVGDERLAGLAVRANSVPSDAQGWIVCEAEAGAITVQVLPRRLQSFAAQRLLVEQAPDGSTDALGVHRLALGTVLCKPGETVERELQLGPGWYR